jgi:hypothetical protein
MPMHVAMRAVVIAIALVALAGCRVVRDEPHGRSPLVPLAASPDVVTLEIFSAPAPLDEERMAMLWREVDEQPLDAELRKRLSQNGLRAGVVGARLPDALAELLKVTDAPISADERALVPVDAEPGVVLRVLQPRVGKRHDLVVSPVHEKISLLQSVDGGVQGKTYSKAEGRLVLRAFPQPDGRVAVELTPELQHGEPKTRTSGSDGMFIWTSEREKVTFADLKLSATLASGEMLLVTCDDSRKSSIGHHFFMRQGDAKPIRQLWVLRVAQAGPDRAFADWNFDAKADTATSDERE